MTDRILDFLNDAETKGWNHPWDSFPEGRAIEKKNYEQDRFTSDGC